MTSLLEKIVAIIAPHTCFVCSKEDNVLCDACRLTEHISLPAQCVLCGTPSPAWRLCAACSASSGLDYIWAAAEYDGLVAKVIQKYKFERVRAAYKPLADTMLQTLPYGDWTVVPVPTAPPRVRRRGYDQAVLLAQYIAERRHIVFSPALRRVQYVRQIGANRVQRQKQSIHMFEAVGGAPVRGAHILLVDDVCTTGATLSAGARVLRAAGAASVSAVVAARTAVKG